jgi:hypothetical protein
VRIDSGTELKAADLPYADWLQQYAPPAISLWKNEGSD